MTQYRIGKDGRVTAKSTTKKPKGTTKKPKGTTKKPIELFPVTKKIKEWKKKGKIKRAETKEAKKKEAKKKQPKKVWT